MRSLNRWMSLLQAKVNPCLNSMYMNFDCISFFFLLHVTCLERKLRIKRAITVPALSNKLADIPPDDYSWRKYGQKPIKGSPHPRYVHVSYSFLSLNQIFFSACKSYWSGMYWLIPSTLQHYV